ncbi:MAG: hypothetical protein H0W50_10515 [Parachlamydiaceae bacterium]|nr:hypothetical protein [Parachlamydiaceae bacterium]
MNNSNNRNTNILLTTFFLTTTLLTPISFLSSTHGVDEFISEGRRVYRPLSGSTYRIYSKNYDWQGKRGYDNYAPRNYNYNSYPYNYSKPYYGDVAPNPYFDYNYYDYYSRYPTLSYPLSTYLDSTSLYSPSRRYNFPAPKVKPHQNYYYYPN